MSTRKVIAISAEPDAYRMALAEVNEMSAVSSEELDAVVTLQQTDGMGTAADKCLHVAMEMKNHQDRIWQIYIDDGSLAVQSLYLASEEMTDFGLVQLAAATMMARGPSLRDLARLKLNQAQLCDRSFAACVEHASLCYEIGL